MPLFHLKRESCDPPVYVSLSTHLIESLRFDLLESEDSSGVQILRFGGEMQCIPKTMGLMRSPIRSPESATRKDYVLSSSYSIRSLQKRLTHRTTWFSFS
jgi:hypothetical protein